MLSHWKRYTAYSIFTGIRWSFTHSSVSARENGISFLIVRYSLHPPVTLLFILIPVHLQKSVARAARINIQIHTRVERQKNNQHVPDNLITQHPVFFFSSVSVCLDCTYHQLICDSYGTPRTYVTPTPFVPPTDGQQQVNYTDVTSCPLACDVVNVRCHHV